MCMQPPETGNGSSVEKHDGEWGTSCRMAFSYAHGLDAVLCLTGFCVYLGSEDLNSVEDQIWVWKGQDRH